MVLFSLGSHVCAHLLPLQNVMATFSRSTGEPVKLWDVRRMDLVTSEIKITSPISAKPSEYSNDQSAVETIRWSALEPGFLSVAIRNCVQDYDTSSGSRPGLVRTSYTTQDILDFALFGGASPGPPLGGARTEMDIRDRLVSALYSRRMIAILSDRSLCDTAKHGGTSPVAISRRDGRLVHTLGSTVWVGSTTSGPAAMEKSGDTHDEDVSATMIRRARCLRVTRYSMDTANNIKVSARDSRAMEPSLLEQSHLTNVSDLDAIRRDSVVRGSTKGISSFKDITVSPVGLD